MGIESHDEGLPDPIRAGSMIHVRQSPARSQDPALSSAHGIPLWRPVSDAVGQFKIHTNVQGNIMKSRIALILMIAMTATMATPKKAYSGILEGALIGGVIGGVVGLIIEASKPKEPKPTTPPSDSLKTMPADSASSSLTNK